MRTETRYADGAELAQALAGEIAEVLRAAIDRRGQALLVLSGGRTPEALYRALSCRDLPWERVVVSLADERWLHPEDPESNENLVRRTLLQGPASAARLVGLKTAATTPELGLAEVNGRLADLPWPIDALVLGMGEDGHTASLFPDAPELPQALASALPAAALTPAAAPHGRISLTPATLRAARASWLVLSGTGKWLVYQQALLRPEAVREMPVRLVLSNPELRVAWAPA
ncbi:MAG: 6-phosphogluconolactonase [Gammaproteobacteria bacterium]|nr:6-phosphogluconolactonase [Gammaproteobacteria bacterium]